MPTETGLSLFGVLEKADPALVDPGVTAQLECLLDEVVLGKQDMVGAIDAVCDVAERIISKLKEGATGAASFLLGSVGDDGAGMYPPTPAMKRFADSLVRQKGIKPPPGYKTSISICRKFLSEHAPKKSDGERLDPKPVSPAQLLYAKKLVQGKGLIIPDDARTNSVEMSAWIDKSSQNAASNVKPQQASRVVCTDVPKMSRTKVDTVRFDGSVPPNSTGHTADSLWQRGGRSEARCPLWLRGWYAPPG